MSKHDSSRRDFIRKAAYVAPVILTLRAQPTLAHSNGSLKLHGSKYGSEHEKKNGVSRFKKQG